MFTPSLHLFKAQNDNFIQLINVFEANKINLFGLAMVVLLYLPHS